jgi:hypothetical protein
MSRFSAFRFVAQNNFGWDDDGSLGQFNKGQAGSENKRSIESEPSHEAKSSDRLSNQASSSSVHSYSYELLPSDDDEASLDEQNFSKDQADSVNEESIESEPYKEAESSDQLFNQLKPVGVYSFELLAVDVDEAASLDEHNKHVVAEEELVDEHVVAHWHNVAAPPDDEEANEETHDRYVRGTRRHMFA